MQKYIQRMLTEKTDLQGKIKKAKEAIDGNPFGMDNKQKELLVEQVKYMESYLSCLEKRIDYDSSKGGGK